jgi:ubiquinone/menaquinone biosynthesis C-methylase UbiE
MALPRRSTVTVGDCRARRRSGLAGLVQVGSRDRVLDVGTGTGLLPFSLVGTTTPPASILGIDISAGMIETARRRLRDELRDDPRVRFERMDAEQLQLRDASFDVVLSGFALTTCRDPESRDA